MIRAYDLRTQRVPCPMGIAGEDGPDFSWKLVSEEHNQSQKAFRLTAASTREKLLAGNYDLYDSGRTGSAETLDVAWSAGMPEPFTRVWWTVTVWDQDDVCTTAEPVWFETGPAPEMWNGKTVFAGPCADRPYTKSSGQTSRSSAFFMGAAAARIQGRTGTSVTG